MRGSGASRLSVAPGGALAGPWVRNPLWRNARAVPSLDLQFADNKSLVDGVTGQNLVTFTRASSGTFVGSDGLIRAAVTNLLLRSEEFNDASWVKTGTTVSTNAVVAPNGTTTAETLIEDTSTGTHLTTQSITATISTVYTFSVFAKAASGTRSIRLLLPTAIFTTPGNCIFNLQTGTAGSLNSGITAASITAFPDGWYRCSIVSPASTAATAGNWTINLINSGAASYTGDGTSGLYLWGAQIEQSSTVGEYIPTTSTINSAPRFDHNPITGESLGLLVEEARTNLSLQSEDFSNAYWVKTSCTITSNESTAPDGTLTADLWTNTGSPGVIENSITKDTTARTYTTSLWVKGTLTQLTVSLDDGTTVNRGRVQYNLSTNVVGTVFNDGLFTNTSGTLTRFPDGWVRVTMTTTTSIGTTIRLRPFFSGTGSTARIWGAQVEEGAFATSYIPTTTATVTRAADVASITGSNFSSWYRQDEGALYAAYSRQVTGTATFAASLTETLSASSANRIQFSLNTNNVPSYALVAAGTTQGTLTPGGTAPNYVTAYGYKLDDVACSSSGSTVATDTTAVMPTGIAYLNIGSNPANASGFLNGTIKRLTYWPVRLANTTLQAISQP